MSPTEARAARAARAAEAVAADPYGVAREVALRQLAMAPRTRAQLAKAIARKGVPDEVAEAVLDRYEEVDLVDDEEFAQQWVRSRHTGRGLAGRALAHELRTRGVADDLVKQAVAEIDPEQELATARDLVRRRLRSMAGDDPDRRARRLVGMLARKGYGPGVALRAVREESAAAALDDLALDDAESADELASLEQMAALED